MKKPGSIKEISQVIETQESLSTTAEKKEINQPKSLIRYFDLIEDTSDSFVLGYN